MTPRERTLERIIARKKLKETGVNLGAAAIGIVGLAGLGWATELYLTHNEVAGVLLAMPSMLITTLAYWTYSIGRGVRRERKMWE